MELTTAHESETNKGEQTQANGSSHPGGRGRGNRRGNNQNKLPIGAAPQVANASSSWLDAGLTSVVGVLGLVKSNEPSNGSFMAPGTSNPPITTAEVDAKSDPTVRRKKNSLRWKLGQKIPRHGEDDIWNYRVIVPSIPEENDSGLWEAALTKWESFQKTQVGTEPHKRNSVNSEAALQKLTHPDKSKLRPALQKKSIEKLLGYKQKLHRDMAERARRRCEYRRTASTGTCRSALLSGTRKRRGLVYRTVHPGVSLAAVEETSGEMDDDLEEGEDAVEPESVNDDVEDEESAETEEEKKLVRKLLAFRMESMWKDFHHEKAVRSDYREPFQTWFQKACEIIIAAMRERILYIKHRDAEHARAAKAASGKAVPKKGPPKSRADDLIKPKGEDFLRSLTTQLFPSVLAVQQEGRPSNQVHMRRFNDEFVQTGLTSGGVKHPWFVSLFLVMDDSTSFSTVLELTEPVTACGSIRRAAEQEAPTGEVPDEEEAEVEDSEDVAQRARDAETSRNAEEAFLLKGYSGEVTALNLARHKVFSPPQDPQNPLSFEPKYVTALPWTPEWQRKNVDFRRFTDTVFEIATARVEERVGHRSTEALRAARREGCPGEEGVREGVREGGARDSAQGVGWILWNSVERCVGLIAIGTIRVAMVDVSFISLTLLVLNIYIVISSGLQRSACSIANELTVSRGRPLSFFYHGTFLSGSPQQGRRRVETQCH